MYIKLCMYTVNLTHNFSSETGTISEMSWNILFYRRENKDWDKWAICPKENKQSGQSVSSPYYYARHKVCILQIKEQVSRTLSFKLLVQDILYA